MNGRVQESSDDDDSDEDSDDDDAHPDVVAASVDVPCALEPATIPEPVQAAVVPSTPIRKPFQPTRGLAAAGQPQLAKPAGAQRVCSLDAPVEEEDEEEEREPTSG